MKKRIISSIMCLAMLLSLLPATAFAAGTPEIKGVTVGGKQSQLAEGKTNEWVYTVAGNDIPEIRYGGGIYANYYAVAFTSIKDTNGYYILCKDGSDLTADAAKALITAAGNNNVHTDNANHEVVKAAYFESGDGPTLWLNANNLQASKKYVVYQATPKAADVEKEAGTVVEYDLYKHTVDFNKCTIPACNAFTQHTDTTAVWGKNLNTLVEDDFKVDFISYDGTAYNEKLTNDSDRGMTIKLSGTVCYVDGWTDFSSDKKEQSGHYVAIDVKNPKHNEQIKQIVLNGTKERTFEYASLFGAENNEDGTIIVRVDDLMKENNKVFTLTYMGNYPTAESSGHKKIATFKFDCSGLKLADAPTGLEVRGYDSSLGVLHKNGSDLQTNIKAGTPTTTNGMTTIPFTGNSKYIFNWTDFSSKPAEQEGNYVALKLTAPGTIKVDGNALDEDGLYVVVLNGSKQYKNEVTVTTKDADSKDVVTKYVLDFTGVKRLAAPIVSVTNKDPDGAVKAKLAADGKIALSGVLTPTDGKFADVTLNVKFSDTVTKEVTVKIAKSGDNLTATAVQAVVANNTLSFDTSMLLEKKETAAEVATVAKPDATVSTTIPAEKKGDADTLSAALTTGNTTKVEKEVLQKYANVVANDEDAKDTLLDSAATVANANETVVPAALKTAIADATKDSATDTDKNKLTTVVQVYPKIEVKDVETTGEGGSKALTTFQISITPMAQTVVTTANAADINSGTATITPVDPTKNAAANSSANAIIVKEEPVKVDEPTVVVLALPTIFTSNTAFVEHIKDGIGTFIYTGTVGGTSPKTLTFTSQHGFSDFIISASDPSVAKVNGVGYKTLAEAIAAADDGDTITLTASCTGDAAKATVTLNSDKKVTFAGTSGQKVTINGKEYSVGAEVTLPKTGGSITTGGGGSTANVSVSSTTNGKVTVSNSNAKKGDTVTVTVTPNTGYTVDTVTVTDSKGNAVEVTKTDDTHYTFVMPDGRVTVKATFKQSEVTPPPATGFTDVAADAYYADAVKWAVDKGITNGLTATTFGPNNSCTRGQMVTFLWRAAGSPAATGTNSFSDVASGEYYYNAVLWAVEKGITNGTSATTFSPNATVNRGQTVTFLYRYAESPAATGDTSFTDVAADAFYADAVKWAVAEEITNGTSSTTFSPASNCTRGQIVTFMYRQMAE